MKVAPLHEREAKRLARLRSCAVLDTDPERAYDDLSALASRICGMPIALVSLVDSERQWFKSRVGLDATETPRSVAFCSHAILRPDDVFIVEDATKDERFADNPLVVGAPHVTFYAGVPLVEPGGVPLGTLCVIDNKPRTLQPEQIEALRTLARQVVSQLELRRTCRELIGTAERLGCANRELEEFTRVAAHDLQEPLRKLVSFGELLREDLGDDLPPSAAEDLGFMTDAALRMRDLIQDLLRLARAGSVEIDRRPLDLTDCTNDALQALSARIEESGAEVVIDPLPQVEGDRTLLTQLFQNLIGNAIKFVRGKRPEVRVTCTEANGEIVVGVRDNGIGIDAGGLEKLFTTFQRLNLGREFEGTGVGLSIARKAVERHGGRVWVESTPGRGSHFQFVLPGAVLPVPA